MLRRWLLALALLCVPLLSQAQCPGVTVKQAPFATETLTISTTVTGLTAAIYQPTGITPTLAVVSVNSGDLRYTVSGTPTATVGHPVFGTPPQTFIICGIDSIRAFQAIRQTADAALYVTYYRNNP